MKTFLLVVGLLLLVPLVSAQTVLKDVPLLVAIDNASITVYCEQGAYSFQALGQTQNLSYVCQTAFNQTVLNVTNVTVVQNVTNVTYNVIQVNGTNCTDNNLSPVLQVDYGQLGQTIQSQLGSSNITVACPGINSDDLQKVISARVTQDFTTSVTTINDRLDKYEDCNAQKQILVENQTSLVSRAVTCEANINATAGRVQDRDDQHKVDLVVEGILLVLLMLSFLFYNRGMGSAILESIHAASGSLPSFSRKKDAAPMGAPDQEPPKPTRNKA